MKKGGRTKNVRLDEKKPGRLGVVGTSGSGPYKKKGKE